jgi:hypothetical protein
LALREKISREHMTSEVPPRQTLTAYDRGLVRKNGGGLPFAKYQITERGVGQVGMIALDLRADIATTSPHVAEVAEGDMSSSARGR